MNIKIFNELNRIFKVTPHVINDINALRKMIEAVFDVDASAMTFNNITELTEQVDNAVLARYFGEVWHPETKKYKYSGLSVIDDVNAMNPDNVIDVGCGYNEFKGKIQNLWGIDPYNKKADENCKTLNFRSDKLYDVAICLGSINFGSTDKIYAELAHVISIVKPSGKLYFRANPGEQHAKEEAKWIDFFHWTPDFIMNAAKSLDCTVDILRMDVGNRYYFELTKNDTK